MTKTDWWVPRLIAAVCLLAGAAPGFYAGPGAASATFEVNKTADTNDGVCDALDCSLREAIQAANTNPGVDQITFGLSGARVYPIQIPGTSEGFNQSGDFNILEGVIVTGNGQGITVVDGSDLDRVFQIGRSIVVTMTGMTIQNGNAPLVETEGGGGILVNGTVILDEVELSSNDAKQGGGISNSLGYVTVTNSKILTNGSLNTQEGGGVYSDGGLFISSTIISQNVAQVGAGASGTESSNITFEDVVFSFNQANSFGGAIYNDKVIELRDCTIASNEANYGAGIYNNNQLYLYSVTLNENVANYRGGGIFNDGDAFLENVTLSQNEAAEAGGGIYNSTNLDLTHATLALNVAPSAPTLYNEPGAVVRLVNTILSKNNSEPNCFNDGGTITSLGHNLEDVNSCALTGTDDLLNQDPKLAALTATVGKTETHGLLAGSPAMETADPLFCSQKDQRGVYRAVDGDRDGLPLCDIGAHEQETAGWVSFSPAAYTTDEGTVIIVTVTRQGSNEAVTVDYSPITAPLWNFLPFSGTLSWAQYDLAPKTFQVTILDDNYRESDQVIDIKLSNARFGAGIHPNGIATILVPENDPFGEDPPDPLYLPIVKR
jgi:CSLREA domain-containing protein